MNADESANVSDRGSSVNTSLTKAKYGNKLSRLGHLNKEVFINDHRMRGSDDNWNKRN